MCLSSGSSQQQVQPITKAATPSAVPTFNDPNVRKSRTKSRDRLRAKSSTASTIATSGAGVITSPNVSGKRLLGQ